MVRWLTCLILCSVSFQPLFGLDVTTLPSPKPDGWVLDQAQVIPLGIQQNINRIVNDVKKTTGGEIALVTLLSLEGEDSRSVATKLLNLWSIGDPQRENGILFLAVMEDRKIDVVLGEGFNDDRHIAMSQTLIDQFMLPLFRDGDPGEAFRFGVRECALQFFQTSDTPPPPVTPLVQFHTPGPAEEPGAQTPALKEDRSPETPARKQSSLAWWVSAGILVTVLVVLGLVIVRRSSGQAH